MSVTHGRFEVLEAVRSGVASDLRAEARRALGTAQRRGLAAGQPDAPPALTIEALRAFVAELVPFALRLPAGADAAAQWVERGEEAGFVFVLRPHAGWELESGSGMSVSSRLVDASRLLPSEHRRLNAREYLFEVATAVAAHLDALVTAYEALRSSLR